MLTWDLTRRIRGCERVIKTRLRRNSLRTIIPLSALLVACVGAPSMEVLAHGGASAAVRQAEAELGLLERQDPDSFLQLFDFLVDEGRLEPALVEEAKKAAREYMQARTRVLQSILVSFINNEAKDDYKAELAEFARLEQSFQKDMMAVSEQVPELGTIYETINDTSLRLPSFVTQQGPGDSPSEMER